jgi:uncharacterized protein (TIGR04255 family)
MQYKIPTKLNKEPLEEAIWSVRFRTNTDLFVTLFPGILYLQFPNMFNKANNYFQPDMPDGVFNQIEQLNFLPSVSMQGDNKTILIGRRFLALSYRKPYPGWNNFSSDINKLAGILKQTKMIDNLDYYSIKYIDFLDISSVVSGLSSLNIKLEMCGDSLDRSENRIVTVKETGEFKHIIQIFSPAMIDQPELNRTRKGILIDIESSKNLSFKEDSWNLIESTLDEAHMQSKEIFFKLLSDKTLKTLEPVYQS